jgi:hypothetical protein
VDAVGWVGGGGLALLGDEALDDLLSPIAGEVVANNRFSSDGFVVAGDLDGAVAALSGLGADNGAPRALEAAGFTVRDISAAPWSASTWTRDLALLRLARRRGHPTPRPGDCSSRAPSTGGRPLAIHAWTTSWLRCQSERRQWSPVESVEHLAYLEDRPPVASGSCRGTRDAGAPRTNRPGGGLGHRNGAASLVERLANLGDAIVLKPGRDGHARWIERRGSQPPSGGSRRGLPV